MKKENRKDDWYHVVRAVIELAAHVGSSKAWLIIGCVYFLNEKWLIDFPKKKISVSFSCLAFILIAFPLGIISRRGSKPIAFVLSLFVIVVYYLLSAAGEALALQNMVNPALSMWVPNSLMGLLGIILSLHVYRR